MNSRVIAVFALVAMLAVGATAASTTHFKHYSKSKSLTKCQKDFPGCAKKGCTGTIAAGTYTCTTCANTRTTEFNEALGACICISTPATLGAPALGVLPWPSATGCVDCSKYAYTCPAGPSTLVAVDGVCVPPTCV